MDIEGGEFKLLSKALVAQAAQIPFLIELHENESQEAGNTLIDWFSESHDVEIFKADGVRSAEDSSSLLWRLALRILPQLRKRINEQRGYEMRWVWATPRGS